MNPESPELLRLISRYLDGEATPGERRELRALERSDPRIAALVDEYAGLDREIGRALREALGRTAAPPVGRSAWARLGQLTVLAAAAGVALMVWINPPRQAAPPGNTQQSRASASWFAPVAAPADTLGSADRSPGRPRVRLRDTDRDWIIIPGERPGEYMVIEVERVRTLAIAIQGNF